MNVIVEEADGMSEHAYLSVRVGETRRMRPFRAGESFAFSGQVKDGRNFMQMDVFEKLGSHVTTVDEPSNIKVDKEILKDVNINTASGATVFAKLKVLFQDPVVSKKIPTRHQLAVEAKNYLDLYDVWGTIQGMIHAILKHQPEDPIAFMLTHLATEQQARQNRHMNHESGTPHPTDLDVNKVTKIQIDPSGRYALSARIRSGRNLQGFRSAPCCGADDRAEIEKELLMALDTLEDDDLRGEYLPSGALESAQFQSDWPQARGVFASASKNFVAWCNEEEHVRFLSLQLDGDLRSAFNRLVRGLQGVEQQLAEKGRAYARSCPSNLVTGLRASVTLRIPRLTRQPTLKELLATLKLQAVPCDDDSWEVSNSDNFNVSEVDIVNTVIEGCARLVLLEKRLEDAQGVLPASTLAKELGAFRMDSLTPSETAAYFTRPSVGPALLRFSTKGQPHQRQVQAAVKIQAVQRGKAAREEIKVASEAGDRGRVSKDVYIDEEDGKERFQITWLRTGLTSTMKKDAWLRNVRFIGTIREKLSFGDEVEALPGIRLAIGSKEYCSEGDRGRVSKSPWVDEGRSGECFQVTWYRTGLTSTIKQEDWTNNFIFTGSSKLELDFGDEVEALPGTSCTIGDREYYQEGDRGRVSTNESGPRLKVTWYRTGRTSTTTKDKSLELFRFVGPYKDPAIGDELHVLPGIKFAVGDKDYYSEGDRGKVSKDVYAGEKDGIERFEVTWYRSGLTFAMKKDSWLMNFRFAETDDLSFGDEVEPLPGTRLVISGKEFYRQGDKGIVSADTHTNNKDDIERINVTWYRTGLTSIVMKKHWKESLVFVGAGRAELRLGDEVQSLPGKRFKAKEAEKLVLASELGSLIRQSGSNAIRDVLSRLSDRKKRLIAEAAKLSPAAVLEELRSLVAQTAAHDVRSVLAGLSEDTRNSIAETLGVPQIFDLSSASKLGLLIEQSDLDTMRSVLAALTESKRGVVAKATQLSPANVLEELRSLIAQTASDDIRAVVAGLSEDTRNSIAETLGVPQIFDLSSASKLGLLIKQSDLDTMRSVLAGLAESKRGVVAETTQLSPANVLEELRSLIAQTASDDIRAVVAGLSEDTRNSIAETLGVSQAAQLSTASVLEELKSLIAQTASDNIRAVLIGLSEDTRNKIAGTLGAPIIDSSQFQLMQTDRLGSLRTQNYDGLGEEECEGFPADVCPDILCDLSNHHSLMADVLKADSNVYNRLRRKQTPLGVTFAKCIKAGIDNACHPLMKILGVVAGDEYCYDTFHELLNPIITSRHGYDVKSFHPTNLSLADVTGSRIDVSGKYAISVRVRSSRSLHGIRFPPACDRHERRKVENVFANALCGLEDFDCRGQYFPLRGSTSYDPKPDGMTLEEEKDLQKYHFLFGQPDSSVMLSSGVGRHWPEARGVFAAESHKIVSWVNEEDHFRIISFQLGDDLREAFSRFSRALGGVEQGLHRQGHCFAHCPHLGYLSSCPSNLGTALRASVMLRIPLLSSRSGFQNICRELGLDARRAFSQSAGPEQLGIWDLSNRDRLGTSEADLINVVINACAKLVLMEQALERGENVF